MRQSEELPKYHIVRLRDIDREFQSMGIEGADEEAKKEGLLSSQETETLAARRTRKIEFDINYQYPRRKARKKPCASRWQQGGGERRRRPGDSQGTTSWGFFHNKLVND